VLEPYGYRWYRIGGINEALERREAGRCGSHVRGGTPDRG
jgi:hypothetical protein